MTILRLIQRIHHTEPFKYEKWMKRASKGEETENGINWISGPYLCTRIRFTVYPWLPFNSTYLSTELILPPFRRRGNNGLTRHVESAYVKPPNFGVINFDFRKKKIQSKKSFFFLCTLYLLGGPRSLKGRVHKFPFSQSQRLSFTPRFFFTRKTYRHNFSNLLLREEWKKRISSLLDGN